MSSLYPREELLLAFCPLSFLDDVEQIIDDYLADGVDILEEKLTQILGLKEGEIESGTDKEKQYLCLKQCGDKFLKVLRENFDKNLDKFDIYCLRNIFTLSDDIKLEHVQEFMKRLTSSVDEKQNDNRELQVEGSQDNNNNDKNEDNNDVTTNPNLNSLEHRKEQIPDIKNVNETELINYLDSKFNRPISSKDEDMIDHELDELRNKLRKTRRRRERVNLYLERSKQYAQTMEEGASSIASSKTELKEYNADSLHESMTLLVQQEREFSQLSNLSQNLQDSLIAGPGGQLDIDSIQSHRRKRQQNHHPLHTNYGNQENIGSHTNTMDTRESSQESLSKKTNNRFDTNLLFSSSGRRSSLSRSRNRRSASLDFRDDNSIGKTTDGVSDIHIRNKTDVHSLIAALTGNEV